MMTLPIVRTACRAGQTAVASIPRQVLSGLLDPVRMFAACASHEDHEACETASESDAGLLREARFRLSTPSYRRTSVLQTSRDVKKNPSRNSCMCTYVSAFRANGCYTCCLYKQSLFWRHSHTNSVRPTNEKLIPFL